MQDPNPPDGVAGSYGGPDPMPGDDGAFERALAELPVAVAVHRDGRLLFVNPAASDLLGICEADLFAKESVLEIVHPDDRAPAEDRARRLERGEVAALEPRTYRTAGDDCAVRYVEATSRGVEYGGLPAVQTILRDVTDEMEARSTLEESEARYRRVFEESLDPIYVSRTDGTLIEMNRAGLELFGLSRRDIAGFDVRELYADPADRIRFQRTIHEYGSVEGFEVRLRARDGSILDCVLNATTRHGRDGVVIGYQGIIRDVTERNRLEERLRVQALRDPLTELPNRTLLWDRLHRAIARADRHGNTIAVVFIDLDRFKSVNDGLGHAAGDEVLRQAAARLRQTTRETDSVARVGGDEFTILLEAAHGPDEVDMVVKRIEDAFAEPFEAGGQSIRLSVSIGAALRPPEERAGLGSRPADELMRRADVAMYAAKERAGTAYVRYDPVHDPGQRDRISREHALHSAVEEGQLVLHYQPIVHLATGRIGAVEALVRWRHPVRGLLTPERFLALAEDTGLIHTMGDWILETAFEELGVLTEATGEPALALHLNLSPSQFEHPTGVERLAGILRASGLPPERIVLEVTEHAVLRDPSRARQVRTLGVRLAVDDVGTGYSSLSYIKELQADTLKIDGSFVRGLGEDPHDEAIVGAVVALGEPLGLDVVAEGIETARQREVALALGCDWGQGHYFGRPVPAGDLPGQLLARSLG